MVFSRLVFRVHAIQRMYQRVIDETEVRHVIATGETVEDSRRSFAAIRTENTIWNDWRNTVSAMAFAFTRMCSWAITFIC
jgi:hypothetical protein